ncbi:MAG: hypothetical protein ABIH68_08690, partial [bacterium]
MKKTEIKQAVIAPFEKRVLSFGKGGGVLASAGRGIFFLLLSISIYAGSPGSSALNFLKIPAAVRAVGMGEAFCGQASGLDAVYYNPAGISQASYQEFTAAHTEWLDGIGYS